MARPAVVSQKILALLERKHQLSASSLVEELNEGGFLVNKTSVYRALDKLCMDGILCRQTMNGEALVYELRDDHHDHLVCEHCGKVEKIACVTKPPTSIEGFTVHHHHTTLYGFCQNCSQKQ